MISEKQKEGWNWGFESLVRARGRVEDYSFTFRELISLKNAKVELLQEQKDGFQILLESKQPNEIYQFFPVANYQKTSKQDIVQSWVTQITKTINDLQEATQSFKRHPSFAKTESNNTSTTNKEQLIMVSLSKLESIRLFSGKIFLDLNQLWLQSDKAIQPRQLLPFTEQLENLTTSLEQLKKEQPWAISMDDYNSFIDTLEEGKQTIGQFKDFILENFPTNKKESTQPRHLMIVMMKWFINLSSVWTNFSEKYVTNKS